VATERRRVLVFTDWYLPGYRAGGPIRSLANLARAIDADFYFVTRITDHHSEARYPGIEPRTWYQRSANEWVFYVEAETLGRTLVRRLLGERTYDRIYLNSLFSPRFTLTPLRESRRMRLTERVILAPRGMLKPGALSVKSGKKRLFLFLSRLTGLYSGILWHATSEAEAEEIARHFGDAARVAVAPNLSTGVSAPPPRPLKVPGAIDLLTVARISPEKGITEAVRFLAAARLSGRVVWDIYGPQQNPAYLEEAQRIAAEIPNASITFHGEIAHERIAAELERHHFLYLATRGENYGHAIADALVHGTPVIISDRTPWQGLEARGCGWALPLEEAPFARALRAAQALDDAAYRAMCAASFTLGQSIATDPAAVEANRRLFEKDRP
jgi:glycosyltransferase involved in cell wall biosynthesis